MHSIGGGDDVDDDDDLELGVFVNTSPSVVTDREVGEMSAVSGWCSSRRL